MTRQEQIAERCAAFLPGFLPRLPDPINELSIRDTWECASEAWLDRLEGIVGSCAEQPRPREKFSVVSSLDRDPEGA